MAEITINYNDEEFSCKQSYDTDDDIYMVEVYSPDGEWIETLWDEKLPDDTIEDFEYFEELVHNLISDYY